jgi:low temperature requirement protein LtrA
MPPRPDGLDEAEGAPQPFTVLSRMRARRRDEAHRVATPLELFFDLAFAAAVAQAGQQLVHALAGGHPGHGVGGYLLVFFAIWWAWVNFTWFASAYDTDDVPYRLATLLQITGVLVLAAGVPRAFSEANYTVAVTGYLIMRVALTLQWLRAARGETGAARKAALTYAAGLVVVQACWVLLLVLPSPAWEYGVGPLIVAELAVPAVAERAQQTPWHPGHIADRYGGFTIIVLGESISAATVAAQSALDHRVALDELLPIAFGGLVVVFAAFWIYFATPIETFLGSGSKRRVFGWGYGHYVIFGSAAAIGAGLEVATEQVTRESHISALAAGLAVTVPTALYSVAVWLVHIRPFKHDTWPQLVFPASAVLVLTASFAGGWAVPLAGLAAAAGLAVVIALTARSAGGTLAVDGAERTMEE